jgi:hypothetical protein
MANLARTFATTGSRAPLQQSVLLRASLPRFSRRSIALAAPTVSHQAGTGYGPAFWKRAAISGGAVLAGTVALNAVLNRETREALNPVERQHLHSTFKNMALGLGIVAATAIGLHRTGFSFRIALKMQSSPWLVMGASLVGCIGTMMLCYSVPPEQTVAKCACALLHTRTLLTLAQTCRSPPLAELKPSSFRRRSSSLRQSWVEQRSTPLA